MARLNVAPAAPPITTHEGGRAVRISKVQELRRTVMACLLWEDSFYEDGVSVADRIAALVREVDPAEVANIAHEARTSMNLRHVPLLLCRELARLGKLKGAWLADVIQRADEIGEFMAIYWKDGRSPISHQVRKGLAAALGKFNAYSLAKYNRRDSKVRLKDVLFLTRPKSATPEQRELWRQLAEDELPTPDTWEVALSAGADKKLTFERLMAEGKLGALALLRNLRNMQQAGVEEAKVVAALETADVRRVLPFRFIAAARFAPRLEPQLEALMFRALQPAPPLRGRTVVLVDVSLSMNAPLSQKSDMRRIDAACGLGMIAREKCEQGLIFTFSDGLVEVPPRRGFALRDAIDRSQPHHGTYLAQAIQSINANVEYDRLIVVSDEQAHDGAHAPRPGARAYMLNVGTFKNGVGYGNRWTHIDGFSEACVRYITEIERPEDESPDQRAARIAHEEGRVEE